MNGDIEVETVLRTHLLGGRISLFQPVHGFRVSIDTVFLAAAVPAVDGDWVLDVGSGSGAAALCLGVRVAGARIRGLEIQNDLVGLARKSAAISDLKDRVDFFVGDLLDSPDNITDVTYNHVLANPPYIKANSGQVSSSAARAKATVEGPAGLTDWLDFCLNMTASKGTVTIVHRFDRLCEILDHLSQTRCQISIMSLIPKIGRVPKRVLVQVTKGRDGPILQVPGLILHETRRKYTPEAEAILRHAQPINLSGSR